MTALFDTLRFLRTFKKHTLICVTVLLLVGIGGCNSLGYYRQAISGQLYILTHRQRIDMLLDDPALDPDLKGRLQQVAEIRQFAASELDLPLETQYSTYVALDRPYVVWNVFAAPEFSMRPRSWCYPIAGCVSYRGYFNEDDAREFADDLRDENLDVYVGGVSAYSTLGWFSDSILSTILKRQEHQLAALLFHELAHQVAYAPGDTEFNESFATAVEREGQRRWLEMRATDATERAGIEERIASELRRQEQFVALVQGAVTDLENLYQSGMAEDDMRAAKKDRLDRMRADYEDLKVEWGGYTGYDAWFANGLNNAQLATVNTYNKLVLAFTALLEQGGGNLPAFYARVRELERMDKAERHARLEALLDDELTKRAQPLDLQAASAFVSH